MKNHLSFSQLDYHCLKAAGGLTEQDIYLATRQGIINMKLMKIFRMLDGLNDPFYNRTTTLTVAADQQLLVDEFVNSGVISEINTTLKAISLNVGSLAAGSIASITVAALADGVIAGQWLARIVMGGTVATYEKIGAGTEASFDNGSGTHIASMVVINSLSDATVDVSSIYFTEFLRISDDRYTSTPGAKIRVFDRVKDPQKFYNHDKDPLATKRIWWYHRGDTIEISVGSAANAIGIVTGEYRGKPALYDDSTADTLIDLPPEDNQMLIDEVVASFLQEKQVVAPPDLMSRMAHYDKMYQAADANRAKQMEALNK